MKKTLLASALLAGISAYAAIPSDINERADLVQKRNEIGTSNIGKAYQSYLQANPMIDKIDVQVRDYVRGDSGATDKTVVNIDWNSKYFNGEDPPVKEIIFNSTIDYSDAVAKEGKLAVIKSEIDAEALAKSFQIAKDSKDFATLNEILKHVELVGVLHDGDKYEQTFRIKPVDAKPEEGVQIAYEGFEYNVHTTDADLEFGYGKSTLKSGKFEASNTKADNDGPKKITVLPFAGEGEFAKNGDLAFNVEPLEAHIDDTVIKAKNFEGKGKNLVYDPVLAGFLGDEEYKLNDIAVASADMPEAVYVKTITIKGENEKSGELYHSKMGFEVIPVSEAFNALTGGMSEALGIESLVGKGELKNLSGTLFTELNELAGEFQGYASSADDPAKQEAAKQELAKRVDSVLAEAGKHNAIGKFNLALNTQNGNAELDAWLEFLKGSKLTYAELDKTIAADTPDEFIKLLGKNVRFEVNFTLPKALADATGMTPMIESAAAGFLKLDGNNYKLVLKNSDKGITLNDEAFPPAM